MDDSNTNSGVGVLDKVVMILNCLESGSANLAQLVESTKLARPTVHRLATAMEHHRLVERDNYGRFKLGSRITELSNNAGEDKLLKVAGPVLKVLSEHTHESTQIYRKQGDKLVCVASYERKLGHTDIRPSETLLSIRTGSAAQVLLAWEDPNKLHASLYNSTFNALTLSAVRKRGWAQSYIEHEPASACVSAPIRNSAGKVVACITVSGPLERMGRQPGRLHAPVVVAAANKLTELLRKSESIFS